MTFSKREIIDFVSKLPDDCAISDVLDQLCLLQKIEQGIEDADNGKVMDHDEFFAELELES